MSSKVNKVTMESALTTLKSMFPKYDDRTLKSYIYKTNGHLERTVELLLSKTDELTHGRIQSSPIESHIPQQETGELTEGHFSHTLPEDFLRFSSNSYRAPRSEELYHRKRPKPNPQLAKRPIFPPTMHPIPVQVNKPRVNKPKVNKPRVPANPVKDVGSINSNFSTDPLGQNPNSENFNTKLKKRWNKWSEYTKKKYKEFTKKVSKKKDNDGEYQPLKMNDEDFDDEVEFELKDESLL